MKTEFSQNKDFKVGTPSPGVIHVVTEKVQLKNDLHFG